MVRSLRYGLLALTMATAFAVLGTAVMSRAEDPAPESTDAAAPTKPEAAASDEKIDEVNDALELFKRQEFDKAATVLEGAAKKHPNLTPAPLIMFNWFLQANRGADARRWLEKAAAQLPNDPESYVIMGNIALQERRIAEAEVMYNKAQELLKNFNKSAKRKQALEVQTISGLAAVAENREKWAAAQADLETLAKLVPNDPLTMQRLARAMFWQRNAVGALEKLREAQKADKENRVVTPEATLGRLYEQFGDHANAVIWMNRALKAAPKDLKTHLIVAHWDLETGQVDEAQAQAAKALEIDPKSLDAMVLCGNVALFKKDYAAAEKYFEEAHLQSPGNFVASNNLALALCEQKDDAKKRKAVEYAAANYQRNQQTQQGPEAASTLGWVYYKNGDLDRAELALRQAFTGNVSPDTLYYMAQVAADRGRKAEAKNVLKAIVEQKMPFTMRPEAKALLEKLDKEVPAKP